MTYQRLAYEDASTTTDMCADCRAVESALHLPKQTTGSRLATADVVGSSAPSLLFEDFPREIKKTQITVSEAATRLANALSLHLD